MSALDAPMGLRKVTSPAKKAKLAGAYEVAWGRPKPTAEEIAKRKQRATQLIEGRPKPTRRRSA